jgi:hypothetical protein
MSTAVAIPQARPVTRTALLELLARLERLSILARPGLAGPPQTARAVLQDEIRSWFPGALGSCIFWLADDEAACFAPGGGLRAALTLHHSGEEVARATQAVAAGLGLRLERRGPHALAVLP